MVLKQVQNFNILIFAITLFTLVKTDSLFTSSIKLCHLLKYEIDNIHEIERKYGKKGEHPEINRLVREISGYIPESYLTQDLHDIDDCLDENKILNRFITNPVNSYMLVYRFISLWTLLKTELKIVEGNSDLVERIYSLNYNELKGAYEAIYRLSVFYFLEPKFLKDGTLSPEWAEISKTWSTVPKHLTAKDMFEIGKIAFGKNDYDYTKSWMSEALNQVELNPSKENKELTFDILDYLSWSEYQTGESEKAYVHCQTMIEINPLNERIKKNLGVFNETRLKAEKSTEPKMIDYVLKSLTDPEALEEIIKTFKNYSLGEVYTNYESSMSQLLCKEGQLWKIKPENKVGNLCYVKKGGNDFGKFISVNVEKIFNEPDAFMLRSIVSDDEIVYFKKLARRNLRTATVHNPATGVLETADYRIQQSSWFNVHSDPIIKRMLWRIRIATGLTLKTTEDLQLANYGIGGYYDTHFDFARKNEPSARDRLTTKNGGRLATYLLYMSDVTIGGRTGFHRVGISVQPSKGDALFWFNLLKDGTGDARTRHIACPVALGTKWVGNFWIRSKGEELSRPCDLQEQNGI